MTTIDDELRHEARCRAAELNFDGDLKAEDMLTWRAAEEIKSLSSKLGAAQARYSEMEQAMMTAVSRLDVAAQQCKSLADECEKLHTMLGEKNAEIEVEQEERQRWSTRAIKCQADKNSLAEKVNALEGRLDAIRKILSVYSIEWIKDIRAVLNAEETLT